MTQEEKSLLFKDLCARLPYTPKIKVTYQQQGIKGTEEGNVSCDFIEKIVNDLRNGVITDMQIYLRPMSSMTDEEKKELQSFYPGSFGGQWLDTEKGTIDIFECSSTITLYLYDSQRIVDWLNKKMFDYRGFIDKGLALEAPEGMYNK